MILCVTAAGVDVTNTDIQLDADASCPKSGALHQPRSLQVPSGMPKLRLAPRAFGNSLRNMYQLAATYPELAVWGGDVTSFGSGAAGQQETTAMTHNGLRSNGKHYEDRPVHVSVASSAVIALLDLLACSFSSQS